MGSQMSSNHLFGNFLTGSTVLYKLWKLAALSAISVSGFATNQSSSFNIYLLNWAELINIVYVKQMPPQFYTYHCCFPYCPLLRKWKCLTEMEPWLHVGHYGCSKPLLCGIRSDQPLLSPLAPHLQVEMIQVVCVILTVHGSMVGFPSCCCKILVIPEQKRGEELCCWVSAFRSTVFRHRAVLCHCWHPGFGLLLLRLSI